MVVCFYLFTVVDGASACWFLSTSPFGSLSHAAIDFWLALVVSPDKVYPQLSRIGFHDAKFAAHDVRGIWEGFLLVSGAFLATKNKTLEAHKFRVEGIGTDRMTRWHSMPGVVQVHHDTLLGFSGF